MIVVAPITSIRETESQPNERNGHKSAIGANLWYIMIMTTHQNITLDPANIGHDTLWAVWNQVPDFLLALGAEKSPVFFNWVLASPGECGGDQIKSSKGYPDDLLMAVPLSHLIALAQTLDPPQSSSLPQWVQSAMSRPEGFKIIAGPTGQPELLVGRHTNRPGRVLAKGSLTSFFDLVDEGTRIVKTRDWSSIHGDLRPEGQTGVVKWIEHQKNPEGAVALERFLSEDFSS